MKIICTISGINTQNPMTKNILNLTDDCKSNSESSGNQYIVRKPWTLLMIVEGGKIHEIEVSKAYIYSPSSDSD